jgi:hypothetical protein
MLSRRIYIHWDAHGSSDDFTFLPDLRIQRGLIFLGL